MRLRIATLVVLSTTTLGALGAQTAAARQDKLPNACKLLTPVLRGTVLAAQAEKRVAPNWTTCEYTDGKDPGPEHQWWVSFGFVPERSAAVARKSWLRTWNSWRGTAAKGRVVARLRGFGADDAFGVEMTDTSQDPASYEALVFWRKGRWSGSLDLHAPAPVADLEEAQDMLKELMRGIPRS